MTKSNNPVDILAMLMGFAEKSDEATEIEVKCFDDGKEDINAKGHAGIYSIKNGGNVKSGIFGKCSPVEVEAMLLSAINIVANLDEPGFDEKLIVLRAFKAHVFGVIGDDPKGL